MQRCVLRMKTTKQNKTKENKTKGSLQGLEQGSGRVSKASSIYVSCGSRTVHQCQSRILSAFKGQDRRNGAPRGEPQLKEICCGNLVQGPHYKAIQQVFVPAQQMLVLLNNKRCGGVYLNNTYQGGLAIIYVNSLG